MTVVFNTLLTPEGDPIKNTWIRAKLVASAGFVPADNSEVISIGEVKTDEIGYFEIDLTPNNQIEPEGSCYLISESNYQSYYVIVPTSTIPVYLPEIITVRPPQPGGAVLGATQQYVDEHDALTLASAKQYTDDEILDVRNESDPFPQYVLDVDMPPVVHHSQAIADTHWVIAWPYGTFPDVSVYDTDGTEINESVIISKVGNNVFVDTEIPVAGSADLRG